MTVTFCGHSKTDNPTEIKKKLRYEIVHLINDGADIFFLGGYGDFDSMAADIIRSLKKEYPFIRSILVIPYLDKAYPSFLYDETIYPPIENTPKKYAITERNKWMIDKADVVVAYITHSWGGAAATCRYAKRKGKQIIWIE